MSVPLFIVGFIGGSFAMPNYWDTRTSKEDEEYNQQIIENIEKTKKAAVEAQKQYEENARQEIEASLRIPEEIRETADSVDFVSVQNDIEQYSGKYVTFTGIIGEVLPSETPITYFELILDHPEHYIVVEYPGPINFSSGNNLTVYGAITDLVTYTTSAGFEVNAPYIKSDMIE